MGGLNRKTQHLWFHSRGERARHEERSSFSGGTQSKGRARAADRGGKRERERGHITAAAPQPFFLHSPPPLKEIERFTQQQLFERRTDGRRRGAEAAPFYLVKPTKCSFDDAVPDNFSTKRREGRTRYTDGAPIDRSTATHKATPTLKGPAVPESCIRVTRLRLDDDTGVGRSSNSYLPWMAEETRCLCARAVTST